MNSGRGTGPSSNQSVSDPLARAVLDLWAKVGKRNRFPIAGNSMRPLIHDGDTAVVEHGTAGVRTGAIILFRIDRTLTAHRVLYRARRPEGDLFYAQGDNAGVIDEVPAGAVVGRVLAIERAGRHLRLDTRLWTVLGWLIAATSWRWHVLYRRGWALKQRRLGPGPNRTTGRLRGFGLAGVRAVINVAQAVGGRWRPGAAAERSEGPPA
jgi:hypothetical protein